MIITMPRALSALAIAVVTALSVAANTNPAAANERPAESAAESSRGSFGPQIVKRGARLMVVWTNTVSSGDTDIYGQLLSTRTGERLGNEFLINVHAGASGPTGRHRSERWHRRRGV